MSFYRAFERVFPKKLLRVPLVGFKSSSSYWAVEGISKTYRDSGFAVVRVGTQYIGDGGDSKSGRSKFFRMCC